MTSHVGASVDGGAVGGGGGAAVKQRITLLTPMQLQMMTLQMMAIPPAMNPPKLRRQIRKTAKVQKTARGQKTESLVVRVAVVGAVVARTLLTTPLTMLAQQQMPAAMPLMPYRAMPTQLQQSLTAPALILPARPSQRHVQGRKRPR